MHQTQYQNQRAGAHRAPGIRPLPPGGICSGLRAIGEHGPRRLAAGRRLCAVCRERIGTSVRALPRLYAECEQALGPGLGGLTQRVSGSRSPGLALNVRAMEARSDIVGVLASWSDLVVGERDAPAPRGRTVGELAEFVTGHLDWLLTHPAADFVHEIVTVQTAARQAVDDDLAPRELGRCLEQSCGSPVRSVVRAGAGGAGAVEVGCDSGHVLSPQQWLLLSRRAGS